MNFQISIDERTPLSAQENVRISTHDSSSLYRTRCFYESQESSADQEQASVMIDLYQKPQTLLKLTTEESTRLCRSSSNLLQTTRLVVRHHVYDDEHEWETCL